MKFIFKFVSTSEFEEVCGEIQSLFKIINDPEMIREGFTLFLGMMAIYLITVITAI